MKRYVTISRKWNQPQINISVSNEEISLQMGMHDFVEALKQELETSGYVQAIKDGVGSVTWVVRKKTFDGRVDSAAADSKATLNEAIESATVRVLEGVKKESAKVMGGHTQA